MASSDSDTEMSDAPEYDVSDEPSSDVQGSDEPSSDALGSDATPTPGASQATTGSDSESPILGIEESGIDEDDGHVIFKVKWDGNDGNGVPWDPSWLPFFGLDAQATLCEFFTGWQTYPQQGTPEEDALDAAAGNPYSELFKDGFLAVLEAVAGNAIAHASLSDVYTAEATFVRMAYQILISIPVPVLQGIMGAGLLRRKARSEDIFAWLTNNLRKSEDRPSVYMIELCDEIGCSLTYKDMLVIVDGVRQYMNINRPADAEFAIKVESLKGKLVPFEKQAIRSGKRKWISSDKSKDRLDELLTNLESRIQSDLAQDPDMSRHMPFLLRDIGYIIRGVKRLDEHLDHTNGANKLMALFALVAEAKGLSKYALHADVIFLAFRDEHAIAAEVLFSLLARSYITSGTGFNSIQAGLSNHSNTKVTAAKWNLWQKDVLEESPMKENAAAEQARIDAITDEIETLERTQLFAQIAALSGLKRNIDILMGYGTANR